MTLCTLQNHSCCLAMTMISKTPYHHISRCLLRYFSRKKDPPIGVQLHLIGRDLISPCDYTSKEIKSLLWTAVDLKDDITKRGYKALDMLCGLNATLLLQSPSVTTQISISNAIRYLGGDTNVILQENWCTVGDAVNLGRCLSNLTSIVIAQSSNHESICRLRDGAKVPIISHSSSRYKLMQGLADMLTLQEHYSHLRGLKLAWVGPPGPLLNTYLMLCPRLGMGMKFVCSATVGSPTTPPVFNTAVKYSVKGHTDIAECSRVEDATYRADVIATTSHDDSRLRITDKIISEAAIDWTLLHDLPRTHVEVTDNVFHSENCLAWKSSANMMWVAMAVVLRLLKEYTPTTGMPDFDGINLPFNV